jgi:hypothetical protein
MGKIIKASLAALLFLIAFSSAYSKNYFPADSTAKEIKGELDSKKGKTVLVSFPNEPTLPEVGTTGTLSKYFEEEILGMNTHGYIDIAEVEVKSIDDNEITFKIIKELTNIKLNGKKENLFKKGIIVKFEW